MKVVSDLHLHSKYSRAVSPQMTLPVMAANAGKIGIDLLAAPDWTHPIWFAEMESMLEESEDGIYRLTSEGDQRPQTHFLLSTEISSIYKQGDKLRRIHNLVMVPSFAVARKVTKELLIRGANLSADGRPIIGISAKNLLELLLEVDERSLLIPCHIWTPHFGIYGSASGFDSLDEAFGDLAPYVYGIETGISSDPEMNWQIPELRTRSILTFSDAHSAPKMGREATVMEVETLTFENVRQAIMEKGLTAESRKLKVGTIPPQSSILKNLSSTIHPLPSNRILYTIEFYPEEGKYHYSGHRNCKVSYGPQDILARGTTCPVCGRQITEGVMVRVQQLAEKGYKPRVRREMDEHEVLWIRDSEDVHPPFVKIVPLLELVAESMGMRVQSKKVQTIYEQLLHQFPSELDILLRVPIKEISHVSGELLAQGIQKMRRGELTIIPGYDGEYGLVRITKDLEPDPQLRLL